MMRQRRDATVVAVQAAGAVFLAGAAVLVAVEGGWAFLVMVLACTAVVAVFDALKEQRRRRDAESWHCPHCTCSVRIPYGLTGDHYRLALQQMRNFARRHPTHCAGAR